MTEDTPLDPRDMQPADFAKLGIGRVSRGDAIRGMCLQCMCGSHREILLCASASCPLWPFRMGNDPWRAPMSEEQRAAAAERMKTVRVAP
jgi:hypothetical protein